MAFNTLPADTRAANTSMHAETTRRALFGAAGLASVAIVTPAIAAITHADTDIERHWHDRARAYREFEADPHVMDDDDAADPYWARIDAAEIAILNSPTSTPRAAEIRLWVAWSHTRSSSVAASDVLVAQGDFAALQNAQPRFDWHEKLIFAAIGNLRGEG